MKLPPSVAVTVPLPAAACPVKPPALEPKALPASSPDAPAIAASLLLLAVDGVPSETLLPLAPPDEPLETLSAEPETPLIEPPATPAPSGVLFELEEVPLTEASLVSEPFAFTEPSISSTSGAALLKSASLLITGEDTSLPLLVTSLLLSKRLDN